MVAYSPVEQARVAEEVAALPEGALIVGVLADYAVLREQVRACDSSLSQIADVPLDYARPSRLLFQ